MRYYVVNIHMKFDFIFIPFTPGDLMNFTLHAKLDASQYISCLMEGGDIQLDISSTTCFHPQTTVHGHQSSLLVY